MKGVRSHGAFHNWRILPSLVNRLSISDLFVDSVAMADRLLFTGHPLFLYLIPNLIVVGCLGPPRVLLVALWSQKNE